jgi:hypothetical protein
VEFALLTRIISDIWVYPREVWWSLGVFSGMEVNALGYPREVWWKIAYYQKATKSLIDGRCL